MSYYVDLVTGHTGIIKADSLASARAQAFQIWGNLVQLVTVR